MTRNRRGAVVFRGNPDGTAEWKDETAIQARLRDYVRVGGKDFGVAEAYFDAETKILNMRGWCIPASGKDYEVKEKEAMESRYPEWLSEN